MVDAEQQSYEQIERVPGLALQLFGPFAARVNGVPLPHLRSRKGQWLLALLALRAERAVERTWLAGVLWPESPGSQGLALLRRALTDLRRALGGEAERLGSPTPHTLLLDLTTAEVDVIAFHEAIRQGDTSAVARAVELYRGPLLEGCVEEWVFSERQVCEQAYLSALERLAERALVDGDATTAVGYLRRAVATDPLRESAQRALMHAMVAEGSHAAALLVYRDLRSRLLREVSAEPSTATTALFHQIQGEARRKSGSAGSKEPRKKRDLCRDSLPTPLTPLLGREQERVGLCRLFQATSGSRLVTLTGPGGTGKTRLALQVAAELVAAFEDGVFCVELTQIREPKRVASAIAHTLGVREQPGRPLIESLKAYLSDRSMLLLLDNFEQVVEAAPVVAELLEAAPRLKVLVTSRTMLRLRGAKEFPVSPLAVPPIPKRESESVDPRAADGSGHGVLRPVPAPDPGPAVGEYPSVALFIQRARDVKPDFALTSDNAPVVAEICRRLDGLPLAIELAAAWVRLFSPQALLERMERRLPLLIGGSRDLPARHQTLRGAIDWSYNLLRDGEQQLFRRLSVFMSGCTLEAVEAVCWATDRSPTADAQGHPTLGGRPSTVGQGEVLEGIAALVDQNLLQQGEPSGIEPRFRMLETIREYGLERLAESGEEDVIRRQHARFLLALVEEAEPRLTGTEQRAWLDRLEMELDDLRAAFDWCRAGGDVDAGLCAAAALGRLWSARGLLTEGRQWLTALLATPGARAPSVARARAVTVAGSLAEQQGDYPVAQRLLEESLAIGRLLGNQRCVAHSLCCLGEVQFHQGDYAAADALYSEGHRLARELQDTKIITFAVHCLACSALFRGDLEAARRLFVENLTLQRELGDQRLLGETLMQLGALAAGRCDLEAARSLCEESLEIHRGLGARPEIAMTLHQLGFLAWCRGNLEAARSLFEESLFLRREIGSKEGIAYALDALGMVAYGQGDLDLARSHLEASLRISREMGIKRCGGLVLGLLGLVTIQQGDLRMARSLLDGSLSILQSLGDRWAAGLLLQTLGRVELLEENWDQSEALIREGLVTHQQCGSRLTYASGLEDLAGVALGRAQRERAARLCAAAEAARDAMGMPRPPVEQPAFARTVAAVRAALGEPAFAAAWAEGQAMSVEQAIAHAFGQGD